MEYGNLFDGSLTFPEKFKNFIHGQAIHELGWTCQDCLMPTYMSFYANMLNSGKLETINYDSKDDQYARDTIWEMFEVSTALMLSTPEYLNNEELGHIGEILDELYLNFDEVTGVENRPQIGSHKEKLRLMKRMVEWNYIGSYSLIDNTPKSSPAAFDSYGDLLQVLRVVNRNYDELKSRGDLENVILNTFVDIRSMSYKDSSDALNHFYAAMNGESVPSFNVYKPESMASDRKDITLGEALFRLAPAENKYMIGDNKKI